MDTLNHNFDGQLLIIGLGSIGLATLPLLLRHLSFTRDGGASRNVKIITGEDRKAKAEMISSRYGIAHKIELLTRENYIQVLDEFGQLRAGDFMLNLSVDVSSCDLIQYCQSKQV